MNGFIVSFISMFLLSAFIGVSVNLVYDWIEARRKKERLVETKAQVVSRFVNRTVRLLTPEFISIGKVQDEGEGQYSVNRHVFTADDVDSIMTMDYYTEIKLRDDWG